MTSISSILSTVHNVTDLWQIAGDFPDTPYQLQIENNTAIAQNDILTIKTVLTEEQELLIRRDSVINISEKPILLRRILSRFSLDPADYQVYTQLNCWEKESLGTWQKLVTGVVAEAVGMRTCNSEVPMMALWNEQTNRGIVYHLLAESSWKIQVRQFWGGWRSAGTVIEMGIHDGDLHYVLQPGETLHLPEIVFYSFRNKIDLDCYKLHNWFLHKHPCPELPVVYNTWLYRFDWFQYDDIAAQVPIASDLGCEYFVIDAGWFGKEQNWGSSMGDYYERSANAGYGFAGRMTEMAELVRSFGMKFGLWMEIERAGADSDALRNHKELFIPYQGDHFLDFRKPEAAEYLLSMIDGLVQQYGVEYLKFDCNGDMFADETDGCFIAWMQGYYHFIRELRRRYPNLYLLNCASGGMRMALNNAVYFDSFWPTDNQNAYESLRIVKDTMLRMPPQWMDRWLTLYSMQEFPYHYSEEMIQDMTLTTGDGTWSTAFSISHSFLQGLTAGGPIGLSCDLTKLSPQTLNMLRDTIHNHKQNRQFWQRASVRILTDTDTILVLQYADPAYERIQICAFAKNVRQNSFRVYPLLCRDALYAADTIDAVQTGDAWNRDGILLPLKERYTCTILTLIKK